MKNIIKFPNIELTEYREHCSFKTEMTLIKDEYGSYRNYPSIILFEEETKIPVLYTGLERYAYSLSKGELLSDTSLKNRSHAVCHFLNFILRQTKINCIHECTLNTVRDFLKFIRTKEDGTAYQKDTWFRYRDYVTDFLINYYIANRENLPFQYQGEDLKSLMIVNNEVHHKKIKVIHNASLYVPAPKMIHKKNRFLVDGYLDLLMYEAKKYEPAITLAIALQAYAGLREGEIVSLSYGDIKRKRKSFGMISDIEINLEKDASFFNDKVRKSNPGTIKKKRTQKVYYDFIDKINALLDAHIALMESKNIDTGSTAPVFVNKQGKPMTVQVYSKRVQNLFYERFLPSLKKCCERQGTYADNAAFIETYETEYPGAHMFRHWFTMYLLTKAKLTSAEIMKWRGDKSQTSMDDYIHENQDLIQTFKQSTYTFQSQLLEDMGYGE